jgi:CspA family cold shock protein
MRRGTVKWFDTLKGYGFIAPEDSTQDVFVHYSAIRGIGYTTLNDGENVEFESIPDPRGPKAIDVVRLQATDL